MSSSLEEIHREMLADLIKRRDLLNTSIANINYELEHPLPPIEVDSEKIEREAQEFLAFLYKCHNCGESLTKEERERLIIRL